MCIIYTCNIILYVPELPMASAPPHPRGPRGCTRHAREEPSLPETGSEKGTTGVSTDGVAADFVSFDGGIFWVLPR